MALPQAPSVSAADENRRRSRWIKRAKNILLDLVFPPSCASCKKEGAYLCGQCRNALRMIPPSCFVCGRLTPLRGRVPAGATCKTCRKKTVIRRFLSPFLYEASTAEALVRSLKYHRILALAPGMAQEMATYLAYYTPRLPRDACFVPIPLHPRRERTRGFNQAELLSAGVGVLLNIPIMPILARTRNTAPQAPRTKDERRTNLEHAFSAPSQKNAPRLAILIDDVKTTGATLEEAARALTSAGVKTIWAVTFAH
ncbi:MAG: hypothetical protein A2847_02745 [Candidatus Sungbacteria bacterium RIFCSPHIGHO2_01_FULL_50_25]|uniref:Double zinc ribbon domain-containing protein n=1 Tax=Candidatus Sungbacteria bacterium RIFCSPHIGHO2_01_FULL_50_25 TaxID=1802265 RepID=A0A1G2KEG1_9BACT|nr:MAG: hypothetical protein A2847_02745 [Candidatus Sungbacteria bacterium RIFCSPHIGHO2_01_FULL_50_25]